MPPSSSSSSSPGGRATTQTSSSTSVGTDASFSRAADVSSHHSEGEGDPEVKESSDSVGEAAAEAAAVVATSAGRVHLSTAHLGAGSHVAFNPFLIPGMSHGLLYPHMFLPHGGVMALPAMPPGAVEAPHPNPRRRKNRGQEEWERKEEKAPSVEESTVKGAASSSFSTSSTPPSKPEEHHGQQAERRDSGDHQPGCGAEEAEQRLEDMAEKVEQDSEGQEEST